MENSAKLFFIICLLFLQQNSFAKCKVDDKVQGFEAPEEIVFYSNGSVFSPVIVLEGEAQILWTWEDNTTSNVANPTKDYGSAIQRKNKLKVTPWSAVRRINIGYDAQDGGSPEIELVANQAVSQVDNLSLVAPYLREWCSSHNMIVALDFSNFVNLETIESLLSQSLQSVNLTNTPKLKRVCFVVNGLLELDLSNCNSLEEMLAGSNKLTNLILPQYAENLWYIGARRNAQLTNSYLFNDLSRFPNLSHLSIWESNQKGDLFIPKTNPNQWIWIRAYGNQYSSIDLRGSFQNYNGIGLLDIHDNKLTKVEIDGCIQIRTLDLSQNLLSSETVDYVLKQLDEFGPTMTFGIANLSKNSPPTAQGKVYQANLEAKGWQVIVDNPTAAGELDDSFNFQIYPNPSHGKFNLHIDKLPTNGIIMEIKNALGQKLMEKKIYNMNSEYFLTQFTGKLFFVTLRGTDILTTQRIIVE